jgi:hypothetical protein
VIPQTPVRDAGMSDPEIPELIYLHPGQMCCCERPSRVETVLGSCVAVTMWNARLQIGCICHAVLPLNESRNHEPLKYVDSSIHSMLCELPALLSEIEGCSGRQYGNWPRARASATRMLTPRCLCGRRLHTAKQRYRRHRSKAAFYSATGEVP